MDEVELAGPLTDAMLVALAREVAINLKPIEDITRMFKISDDTWRQLSQTPRFTLLLEQHITEWESAHNTHERTRVKAGAMIEDWLPEAHARLHDSKETLSAKNELAKVISRLAGMGLERAEISNSERFSVTINLGGGRLNFEHELPPKVISPDASD